MFNESSLMNYNDNIELFSCLNIRLKLKCLFFFVLLYIIYDHKSNAAKVLLRLKQSIQIKFATLYAPLHASESIQS